jgi:hypothetical protein
MYQGERGGLEQKTWNKSKDKTRAAPAAIGGSQQQVTTRRETGTGADGIRSVRRPVSPTQQIKINDQRPHFQPKKKIFIKINNDPADGARDFQL